MLLAIGCWQLAEKAGRQLPAASSNFYLFLKY
jgi:hypothetical protein